MKAAMQPISPEINRSKKKSSLTQTILIILALAAFCALFVLLDQAYYQFVNQRFPNVGNSARLATLFGLVSRLHVLIPCILMAGWRPRHFGLQIGKTFQNWKLILLLTALNCAVIGTYLWLSGGTPYSGNQWLLTEVITVPIVEEIFWRGIVFTALRSALRKIYPETASSRWAIALSGIAFGLLHAANGLAGVPLQFAALQAFNAVIWGLVYGFVRSRTESVYPSIFMHAAMNLVVILF
jgi:membrane protease YdiL (CAAX protease family)